MYVEGSFEGVMVHLDIHKESALLVMPAVTLYHTRSQCHTDYCTVTPCAGASLSDCHIPVAASVEE